MKRSRFFHIGVRKAFFFALFFLLYRLGTAQVIGNNIIPWSADYKLKWEDFQGIPDENDSATALVRYRINVYSDIPDDDINILINVNNLFVKNKSWSKCDVSENLLKHEQGHFDIAEIYARKIRMIITKTSYNSVLELMRKIETIKERQFLLLDMEQEKYDNETNRSRNLEAQNRWSEEIEKRLMAVNDYSNPVIILKIPKGNFNNIPISEIELRKLINEFIEKDTTITKTP